MFSSPTVFRNIILFVFHGFNISVSQDTNYRCFLFKSWWLKSSFEFYFVFYLIIFFCLWYQSFSWNVFIFVTLVYQLVFSSGTVKKSLRTIWVWACQVMGITVGWSDWTVSLSRPPSPQLLSINYFSCLVSFPCKETSGVPFVKCNFCC